LGYSLKEEERPSPEESFKSDEDDFFFNSDNALKFLLLSSISTVFFSKTSGLDCFIAAFAIFFFFFSI
jgi:hypothetical protein